MHVVIVYQYFGTPQGSWSTRVYELCRRWVLAGHKVTVITSPYEKSDIRTSRFVETQIVEGIELKIIDTADSNRLSLMSRGWRALVFACFSVYYAAILKYDVIICSSGPITVGWPGIWASYMRGKPFIFEVRDLWPAGGIEMKKIKSPWLIRLALGFEAQCYRAAQCVVTASVGQQAHIQKRFPELMLEVIPNASDLELFGTPQSLYRPVWSIDKKIFTHIGSLGFIHNVGLLIQSMHELERLGHTGIILVLIGEGADRKKLEKQSASLLNKTIFFLGLMPKKDLPAWVQQSVATLFTTLNNPVQNTSSPNKVFDSLAAGTPVIQTTTGWLNKLFEKEQCGLNVPPDDPQSFAAAMLRLATEDKLRAELAINAKRVAQTQFNRDLLATRYLALLQKVHAG